VVRGAHTRGNFDEPGQWAGLLDRERHRVGGDEASEGVYVHAPGTGMPFRRRRGMELQSACARPLEGLAPRSHNRLHGALRTMSRIESSSTTSRPRAVRSG